MKVHVASKLKVFVDFLMSLACTIIIKRIKTPNKKAHIMLYINKIRTIMSKKITILLLSFTFIVLHAVTTLHSSTSNPPLAHTNAPGNSNCTSCHSGSSLVTSGTIWNNASLTTSTSLGALLPNTTYTMSLTFADPLRVKYGFQLLALPSAASSSTASIGLITPGNTDSEEQSQGNRQYLFHTAQGTIANGNTKTWTFEYTTPATLNTNVVFHVVFNSTNNNISSSGDVIYYKTFSATVLPVMWGQIQAEQIGNKNRISWQTLQEINNNYFSIEKSYDAQNWLPAGTINGAGNSMVPRTYVFEEDAVLTTTTYYRIGQTDFDGTTTYSNVVTLEAAVNKPSVLVNAFANNKIIHLSHNLSNITFGVFNTSGILMKELICENNNNMFDLNDLPSGVYILKSQTEGVVFHKKVLLN
jgi:hypothetical protein